MAKARRNGIERFIPLAVFFGTLAMALLCQSIYRDIQSERGSAGARLAAENFSTRLETHVAARLNAGWLLGRRVLRQEDANAGVFHTEAAFLHDLFSDFQALNWVDAEGVIQIVTPEDGNAAALGLDLRQLPLPAEALAMAEETGAMQVTPPLTLAQGGVGFVAYVPVSTHVEHIGYVNIVFRAEPLIRNALGAEMARSYAVRVSDADTVLFTSGLASFAPGTYEQRELPVAGRIWHVQVMPNAAGARPVGGTVDEWILVGGGALAGLLAVLSYLLIGRQAALRESREKFRDFSSVSSDWYWETDNEFRFTWISKGFETFFGMSREDAIGKTRAYFREANIGEEAWEAHQADLRAHRPFRDFVYASQVTGKRRWVRVSGVPIYDERGDFQGYRGTAADSTDLVLSRGAAEKANARLASAVEGLNEVFSLWDEEDRLVFGNRMFRELNTQIPEVTAPGTRFEDYLRAGVYAGHMPGLDGREEEFIQNSLVRRYTPGSEAFEVELTDGTVLLINEQGLPDGGIIATALDVTQQKRSEAALRASEERLALASQQLSIWDWNLEANAFYMSPGFAERLGYSPKEFGDIRDSRLASIIHPDDVAAYQAKLEQHLEDPKSGFVSEQRFRTRAGEYRWFLSIGQAETNAEGTAVRSTGVVTDIHERIELQNALRQAQKMEAIGNLTGGIAHDFNNLLTVILGNLELIRECYDDGDARELVEAGITATHRGADLVRNMLGFARKSRLQPVVVDINDLLESTASWVKRTLPETIVLETEPVAAPWEVTVDPTLAQNVLLNLILNARDAMTGGGTLFVGTENVHLKTREINVDGDEIPPGRYVCLTVRDTGKGIKATDLDKVFEPFFTTKPPGDGSGLGLSLVHGFMKQSGGAVRVRSRPGKGSAFELFFPANAVEARQEIQTKPDSRPQITSSGKIFLVEDEAGVLNVLERMLSRAGYSVETATSGDEALARWGKIQDVDLLITDIVMPGKLQGTDLARVLHKTHPDLPVIFLSGYAPASMSDGSMEPSDGLRLMKPVTQATLLEAVEQAMGLVAA